MSDTPPPPATPGELTPDFELSLPFRCMGPCRLVRSVCCTTCNLCRDCCRCQRKQAPATPACPGCAKVARHPGEGYVCSMHPLEGEVANVLSLLRGDGREWAAEVVDRLSRALAASEEARAKALQEYEIAAAAAWEIRDKEADRLRDALATAQDEVARLSGGEE